MRFDPVYRSNTLLLRKSPSKWESWDKPYTELHTPGVPVGKKRKWKRKMLIQFVFLTFPILYICSSLFNNECFPILYIC